MNLDFKQMYKIAEEHLQVDLDFLEKRCSDPAIREFIYYITFPMLNPDEHEEYDFLVGMQLATMIGPLARYDFYNATTNNFHFQCDWAYQLNQFIGNYFLDDAGFTCLQTGTYKTWEIDPSLGNDEFLQDPRILIAAARDNVSFFNRIKNQDMLISWDLLKGGMTTSGEVERLKQL